MKKILKIANDIRWWTGRVIMFPFYLALTVCVVVLALPFILFAKDVRCVCGDLFEMSSNLWSHWRHGIDG
jgi:hypothetical protein